MNGGIFTIPNVLTLLRLVLAPLIYIAAKNCNYRLGWGLFAIASVTDWADGFIARRFDQGSDLGRYIDPLADKALTLCSFMAMYGDVKIFWLVILRDVIILLGAGYLKISETSAVIAPSFASKLNTTFLFMLVFGWFWFKSGAWIFGGAAFSVSFAVLQFLIVITTAVSLYEYKNAFCDCLTAAGKR
jgi:cardiolipin synthase